MEVEDNLTAVHEHVDEETAKKVSTRTREAVLDKGYHSNEVLVALEESEIRAYISKPERSPLPEAAALVHDVIDEPAPVGLLAWLDDLRARDIDLGWVGNESGPGLVHTIEQPLGAALDVRAALLAHAREHADLVALVREHTEVWLEDGGGVPEVEGRLVPDDPACGWIEDLALDAITDGIQGHAGAWLDLGTSHARPAWRLFLPGSAILATLHRTVDQPTIVAVCSAPTEPVLTLHLVGGIDRTSGALVGFVLQRVWT